MRVRCTSGTICQAADTRRASERVFHPVFQRVGIVVAVPAVSAILKITQVRYICPLAFSSMTERAIWRDLDPQVFVFEYVVRMERR